MFKGMGYLIRGFKILNQPGLRRYVVVPLMVNIALFTAAAWLAILYFEQAVDHFMPAWLDWLAYILWPLFAICLLVFVFFSFALLANLIAAPFYGDLSVRVEAWLRGQTVVLATPDSGLKSYAAALRIELKKLSYYLVRAIPLLILSLVPGLNLLAFPLWLTFSAWFLAYDAASYSFENAGVPFEQQLQHLRAHRWKMLTFGGLSLGLTATPVINVMVPAAAVAGMTAMLYEQRVLDDSQSSAIRTPSP